jgi:hypothetical protein
MPKQSKFKYKVTLEHLHTNEEFESISITQIHKFVTETLQQYYIDYKDTTFLNARALTRLINKIETNDYLIYKAQKTLVRVYKNLNPIHKKAFHN